jgi:hypothetical protein
MNIHFEFVASTPTTTHFQSVSADSNFVNIISYNLACGWGHESCNSMRSQLAQASHAIMGKFGSLPFIE